jgi:hypothetical protein
MGIDSKGLGCFFYTREGIGPEHPDTLGKHKQPRAGAQSQGKYKAAEEMHWWALKLKKKVLGPEHLHTLMSMHNLGLVLRDQRKYEAAKEMHWQALELYEKVLAPEHPHTLASMHKPHSGAQ